MSYQMVVEISDKEKKKVLEELVQELSPQDHIKFLLKSAKDLRCNIGSEEKVQLLADLSRIFGVSNEKLHQRVAKKSKLPPDDWNL